VGERIKTLASAYSGPNAANGMHSSHYTLGTITLFLQNYKVFLT